jgi:hypothetical protein
MHEESGLRDRHDVLVRRLEWPRTDVGTRTIIPIRLDRVHVGGSADGCILNEAEATLEVWLDLRTP